MEVHKKGFITDNREIHNNMGRNKSDKIQLIANNQFSDFYFYITASKLEEYLNDHFFHVQIDDFLDFYKASDGRKVLDWLKRQVKIDIDSNNEESE
jgi:hypothetical protein